MRKENDKWIDDVLGSMKESKRAKPHVGLLAKIEQQLFAQEASIISMSQWRLATAVAVLLLVLNVVAIQLYLGNSQTDNMEMIGNGNNPSYLISDYKLYDL